MEENCVIGAVDDTAGAATVESQSPEAAGEVTAEAVTRLPDMTAWLPENMWPYAVPVILLLFLWLFYPVILVLICIILALWWWR